MTDIKRYSKEWFVQNGNQNQKNAVKNINSQNFNELKQNESLYKQYLYTDTLLGTEQEVKEKFSNRPQSTTNDKEKDLINKLGGIENVFKIIDANGDGRVTNEEIAQMASVDTEDWAYTDDIMLSAEDIKMVYENVTSSEGANVRKNGNRTTFQYQDGSKTVLVEDSTGHVISKNEKKGLSNSERQETNYDYVAKVKTDKIYNSDGKVKILDVDKPGTKNDKSTSYGYAGNIRVEISNTVGRKEKTIYINNELTSKETTYKYDSLDGEVGVSSQHNVGDCWLLSQVNTLRDTTVGKQIIRESIHKNDDGTVTVNLKGVNKSYTFTPEQICAREYVTLDKTYSTGDYDMKVIELAFTEWRKEQLTTNERELRDNYSKGATMDDPLDSGRRQEAIYCLTGVKPTEAFSRRNSESQLNKKAEHPERYTMTASFKEKDFSLGTYSSGESKITTGHQYCVSRIEENTVYVVNPWNSSEEIAYPKDRFLQNCNITAIADMNTYVAPAQNNNTSTATIR